MNSIFSEFLTTLSGSYGNLIDEARWILSAFIALEIVFFGIWWAISQENRVVDGLKMVLKFGFWIWIVTEFPTLSDQIIKSFIQAGFRAVDAQNIVLTDPGAMMTLYFKASKPIISAIEKLSWYELGELSLYGLSLIMLLLSYLMMTAQIFLITLEFYIVSAVMLILMPFGVFKPTKFLAEKAIGAIVSFGIKFMVIALLLGIAKPVLDNLIPPNDTTIAVAMNVMISTALIAFLLWRAPNMAAGLLSGIPSLGVEDVKRGMTSSANITSQVVQGSVNSVNSVRKATSAGASLATRAAGAVSSGAKMAYTASQMGGAGKAASVMAAIGGGISTAGKSLVKSTVSRAAGSVASAGQRNMNIGKRAGFVGSGGKMSNGMKAADNADRQKSQNAPAWAKKYS